jgi:hypothetical protein
MNEKLTNSTAPKVEQMPTITRTIGTTTYRVFVHFSETSKETITDKVMRLIQNDAEANSLT